jgi:hypothetical protein
MLPSWEHESETEPFVADAETKLNCGQNCYALVDSCKRQMQMRVLP